MSQWIAFHVTERCGLSCRHCIRDPGRTPADLSLAVVEKVLGEAVALHGIRHASFTGGDPLLWPYLEGAVDAAVRRGFTWRLVTSGRNFSRLAALLDGDPARSEALTVVDVSLDGAVAATHDAIRGDGSYRDAMAAIAACSGRDWPFAIQMTLLARNQSELEAMALLAAELGAKQLNVGMMHATGRPSDRDMYLSPVQWDRLLHRIERIADRVKIHVAVAEGFRRGWRFHVCEPFRSEVLHVTPRGKLNLCCNHSGVPGDDGDVVADLATESLADGHRKLLALVHGLERERLDRVAAGPVPAGWDDFPCNRCLARFGRPHWGMVQP